MTPMTVGVATVVIGALVLAGWLPLRERPGLGTVCNVVVIGLAIDVMLPLFGDPEGLVARWASVAAGIGLIGLGSGLYLSTDLGPGPRDGLMTGISRRTGWPVATVRAVIELSVLAAGWALGGTVGLGTLAFALAVGPAVALGLRLVKVAYHRGASKRLTRETRQGPQ